MANKCTNMLYLSTRDKALRDSIKESIEESFDYNSSDSSGSEVFDCYIEFESRWTLPREKMDQITNGLSEDNDLYIRVLSYEFGCDYVEYNVYTSGEWSNKFTYN